MGPVGFETFYKVGPFNLQNIIICSKYSHPESLAMVCLCECLTSIC
jgi:hypothetical protein